MDDLVRAAKAARERAYAPYSGFAVGAAVQGERGIYCGCNVENASYGLSICAEQSAVAAAVCAGERTIRAVAIAAGEPAFPCGACRQVLAEFAPKGEPMQVYLAGEEVQTFTLDELLPNAFRLELRGE
ncbi:MAG: cytidine deaminase [Armatimonadota bacterium]